MDAELRRLVRERAGSRCEYCGMRQEFDELPFQIEHVIPRKHHGSDEEDNLALACFACNNHKGPNLSGVDPPTGQIPADYAFSASWIVLTGRNNSSSFEGRETNPNCS